VRRGGQLGSDSLNSSRWRRCADAGERGASAIEPLTARDLVSALRAVAHGADASEVLGNTDWQAMFEALLSLLLKKNLIADWEYVEELRNI